MGSGNGKVSFVAWDAGAVRLRASSGRDMLALTCPAIASALRSKYPGEKSIIPKGEVKLIHHLNDGTISAGGVRAAISVLAGGRGGVDLPTGATKSECQAHLEGHMAEINRRMDGSRELAIEFAFPHEHAARLNDPDKYKSLRRENDKMGAGVDVIWGVPKDDGPVEIQAFRFDAERFTETQAKDWLKEHKYHAIEWEPSKPVEAVLSGKFGRMISCGDRRVSETGQPIQRFRKCILRDGEYVKASDGIRFTITPTFREHLVATFGRMKAAGIKVPVPEEHSNEPSDSCGEVVGLSVDSGGVFPDIKDGLFADVDLIGNEAIAMADTADVSVFIPPQVVDGKANVYKFPLRHLALTDYPVVTGLGKFRAIAASFVASSGGGNADNESHKQEGKKHMTDSMKKLCLALGIPEDEMAKMETDEEATEKACSLIADLQKAVAASKTQTASLAASQKELTELKASLTVEKPSALLLSAVSKSRRMELTALVKAGVLDTQTADKLADIFVGKDGSAIALSVGGKMPDPYEGVVAALIENKPVSPGEKTAAQIALSDSTKGDGDKPGVVGQAMAAMYPQK